MDVRGLARTMKQISKGTTNADNPVNILIGTVTKLNPLEVNVDQRFTLPEDFFIVPESLTRYTVMIGIQEVVIREGLIVGDPVILLRVQGGQQYVVFDRVVT